MGLDCVRTRQYANSAQGHKSPDVVCDRADIWFEVKRTEHLSPYRFLDQALSDSRGKQVPAVVMRSSHRPWLLMIRLDIDPALAGSVVLTTVTDVVGFVSFLGLATLFYA